MGTGVCVCVCVCVCVSKERDGYWCVCVCVCVCVCEQGEGWVLVCEQGWVTGLMVIPQEYCVSDIAPIVMARENKKQKVLYQYMGNVYL